LGGLVDLAAEAKRLEKEIAKAEKELAGVSRTLGNPGFVAKAAPEIIEKKQAQQTELEQRVAQLKAQAADLA
jgi:valyl-tRNA synthetase